jgi:hypothetical protein
MFLDKAYGAINGSDPICKSLKGSLTYRANPKSATMALFSFKKIFAALISLWMIWQLYK